MQHYGIAVSRWYEIHFAIIGRIISASCYVIGWFMPFFFAGKLESGNVCEYFWMKQYFNKPGIHDWDLILYEMRMKEKEHEIYFLNKIKQSKVLPYFERLFNWGFNKSANNIDLDKKYPGGRIRRVLQEKTFHININTGKQVTFQFAKNAASYFEIAFINSSFLRRATSSVTPFFITTCPPSPFIYFTTRFLLII